MKIIKSLRKSISLKIDETWKLIVKAPIFISQKRIEDFIEKNKNWIEKKKQEILEKVKDFQQGELFYFMWDEYELKIDKPEKYWDEFKKKKFIFTGREFVLHPDEKQNAQDSFTLFYKQEAKKYLSKKLPELAGKNNLDYKALKITSAKTRWWSCTSQKNINFTYRLIMAPLLTIDYVIIHELAHLVHMDHSRQFWIKVDNMFQDSYFQDYKIHKKWLSDNGNKLMF